MTVRNMELLMDVPLFKGLSHSELANLDQYIDVVEFEAGTTVFSEGEQGDFLCLVISGQLGVYKKSNNGEDVQIARLPKGRSIGEMAIIDSLARSATIRAIEDTTLSVLKKRDFDVMLEKYPLIGVKILKYIARTLSLNLRRTSDVLAHSIHPSTKAG